MDLWITGIPCTGCVPHTAGYLAHGSSEGEARGRSRHKNNSERVVRNMEERNVGRKGKRTWARREKERGQEGGKNVGRKGKRTWAGRGKVPNKA